MNFYALRCFFVLFTTVKCTQQLSCHPYQKNGLTHYPLSGGILDAHPTGCEASYELKNGTSIANVPGNKLPYVKNATIKELIATICFHYIGITLHCISEKYQLEVQCNISCNEPTPSTVDQSPKPTPSTEDQRNHLLLKILLPIGLVVAVAIVALVLVCQYKGTKIRFYTSVKTTNEGLQAKNIELGVVNEK